MKRYIGIFTLIAALSGIVQLQAADSPVRSDAKATHDQVQQMLKARDAARLKAEAAEKKMREAGAGGRVEALGFASARSLRDRLVASRAKADAYEHYAKTARLIEEVIRDEIERGMQSQLVADIARFERLQAEVDLARFEGRLPVEEK